MDKLMLNFRDFKQQLVKISDHLDKLQDKVHDNAEVIKVKNSANCETDTGNYFQLF